MSKEINNNQLQMICLAKEDKETRGRKALTKIAEELLEDAYTSKSTSTP